VNELSSANDKLRAQLSEKERTISVLQMTVSSLESRADTTTVGQETLDRTAALPLVIAAADHGHDLVSDVFQRVARQLMADCEELDILGQTIDQVDSSSRSTAFLPLFSSPLSLSQLATSCGMR